MQLHHYTQPSPVGDLLVVIVGDAVCAVSFDRHDETLELLAARLKASEPVLRRESPFIKSAFDDYFSGVRRSVEVPFDLLLCSEHVRRVLTELVKVGFGGLTTYGELARRTQSSPRAVGQAVGRNPLPVIVPCHRVIAADGSLGGFSGGLDRKRTLLTLEGHAAFRGGWRSRRAPVGAGG
ncbi:MAG: methylated-DNA--[protein]-cysteine S-methyltransferase [Actinomycetota bacterium]|nr:methylated-DNA--[protein]-cysteine S-methyltransferase [Actinomycetota bacterium]